MSNTATYIILENSVLLSKKRYSHWRDIQDEYFNDYKTSLTPMTCEEIISFFEDDYKEEESWPFSRERIVEFFQNDEKILNSKPK